MMDQATEEHQEVEDSVPQLTSVLRHSDTLRTRRGHRRTMSFNPSDLPMVTGLGGHGLAKGHGHRRTHSFVPQSVPLTPLSIPNSYHNNGQCPPAPVSPYSASLRRDLSPNPLYSPTSNHNNNNNNNTMPHRPRVWSAPIEDNIIDDDISVVSPLGCGSIRPNPNYDPAKDPMLVHRPFIPPLEITVKTMVPVPDWLRMDPTDSMSIPSLTSSSKPSIVSMQKSNHTAKTEATTSYVINGKPIFVSPRHVRKISNISIGSIVGQSSLHTSPTEDSSYGADAAVGSGGGGRHERKSSLVRAEFKHFIGKMPLFSGNSKKDVNLQRARGCLT